MNNLRPAASQQKMPGRRVTIGLMGPYGFGNLGDAAIQQAMIAAIRQYLPHAEIIGVSLNPDDTAQRHAIPAYPIGRMANNGWEIEGRPGAVLRAGMARFYHHQNPIIRQVGRLILAPLHELLGIRQTYLRLNEWSVVFASGGGQIDDDWGGPWHHPYSMWLWAVLCHARKVKYRLVSVGAGPLASRQSVRLACGALRRADYRSFRDERSRKFMAERGFFRDDPIYPDLAHSLPVDRYLIHTKRAFSGPMVGLGPMAYCDPRVWPKKNLAAYRTYLDKLAEFTAWLTHRGYSVLLFPGEAVHDRDVIHDFLEIGYQAGLRLGENICAPAIETVDELMHALASVDLVVAARFHGVLLPMLLNKPVLATSYHPKIDELMKDTGQVDFCLQIDNFSVAQLQSKFMQLETDQEDSRRQIRQRVGQYRQALEEQYERIFADL